jgi:hypothetical protein
MSSYGLIDLAIYAIPVLMGVFKQLELKHQRDVQIKTYEGAIKKVDIEIKDPNGRSIGFQKKKDGSYAMIADCGGLTSQQKKVQKDFINTIKKRYAYGVITEQLKSQGYEIVEESKAGANSVKLIARRWVS